jgi:Dolichyl-phosphate-mannose-protein mannosyltransferase
MMPSKPAPTATRANRWATTVVLLLLLILSAQILHAIHGQSLTWDEDDHIFAGYETWKTHDFGLNPEHPPMVKLLATLPLLPLHLSVPPLQNRFFKAEAYLDGQQFLFHNGPADGGHYSAETLVFRARLPTLLFTLAAALLVFFAAREMFNLRAGLIALTLFCFDPNLLAHGAYVTTDMAASCTIFATIYALWRYLQRPSPARLIVVGLAVGLALAAKHSTVLLAPMLVLLLAGELALPWLSQHWLSHKSGCPTSGFSDVGFNRAPLLRRALHLLAAFAVLTLIGVIVLWAFYGFRYAARPAGLALSPSLTGYVGPLAGIEARGILFAARFHLLPESYLYGLADVRKMANDMPSFFFGKVYRHGIWYYFPIVFLIKSTLALLAALALTLFAIARGWLRNPRALWFLIAPPALYFAVAMSSHLNIGARHILPVWVFCCVLAGAGLSALIEHNRRWIYPVAALLVFQVATTLHASPNYMAYSNEAWGGPTHTYRYLSDSNTDWGQQLLATSAYLRDHHITHCYFAYFVTPFVLPRDYGIPCEYIATNDDVGFGILPDVPRTIDTATDGPLLISAGDLNGFESGSSVLNPYQSLMNVQPSAMIQDGILVFNGRFTLPLVAALPHVDRAQTLSDAHNIPAALHEAILGESLAPGAIAPELMLGDTEAAAGNKPAAREAYARATTTINTMEPDARDQWLATVQKKLATL